MPQMTDSTVLLSDLSMVSENRRLNVLLLVSAQFLKCFQVVKFFFLGLNYLSLLPIVIPFFVRFIVWRDFFFPGLYFNLFFFRRNSLNLFWVLQLGQITHFLLKSCSEKNELLYLFEKVITVKDMATSCALGAHQGSAVSCGLSSLLPLPCANTALQSFWAPAFGVESPVS